MIAEDRNTSTESTGIMPWLVWGSAALFFLYEYLQRVAPSVMVDDLMRAFAIEGAGVGELGAFYYYAYAILQIPVGVLADRYGPRRPLVLAALLCVVGSVLFAMAHGFASAALGRLLIGTGSDFHFAMASIIVLVIVGILAGFFVRETHCRQQEGLSVGRGPRVDLTPLPYEMEMTKKIDQP